MEPLQSPDWLAERWGTTLGALAQHRYMGTGPKFVKFGKTVRYRLSDVLDFEEANTKTQTGERVAS